jgi:shikimate dehydrogenase
VLTRRAAVLGKPIAHSLSPAIHKAGYAAAGLTGWSYVAIECAEAELPDLVGQLGPEWTGLSLTMPLKEVALAVAGEVAPLAATLGAANTLVRDAGGGWRAENTDAPGMVEALGPVPSGGHLVVLGAGGTARAALGAVARLSATRVAVAARRVDAVDRLDPVATALGLRLDHYGWADAASLLAAADLAVSTVPEGAADPLADRVAWRAGTVLLDVLYHPWPTPLAAAAGAAGCRVVSGLDLLLAQAARQFELFTGMPAPVAAMRAALPAGRDRSLSRRSAGPPR